jgi:hypothetical protein
LVLAVFAVFSVIVLPSFATEALPEGVKITGDKYFVYDFNAPADSTGKITPIAVFKSIEYPDGVKLDKQWLIGRSDSTVMEVLTQNKFIWRGLLPKHYKEGKAMLVRHFLSADKIEFEWREIPGQDDTLKTAIIFIILMIILYPLIWFARHRNERDERNNAGMN